MSLYSFFFGPRPYPRPYRATGWVPDSLASVDARPYRPVMRRHPDDRPPADAEPAFDGCLLCGHASMVVWRRVLLHAPDRVTLLRAVSVVEAAFCGHHGDEVEPVLAGRGWLVAARRTCRGTVFPAALL